jgi:hypothetical protein
MADENKRQAILQWIEPKDTSHKDFVVGLYSLGLVSAIEGKQWQGHGENTNDRPCKFIG